ncbi:MAG: hypothetical protein R3Y29_01680 [bacterium]
MIQTKVKECFEKIGISSINASINKNITLSDSCHAYIKHDICEDIEDYKKGLKKALKIYKQFKFDTLLFKIEFPYCREEQIENEKYIIVTLNKFLDICKIRKPASIKKVLYRNQEGLLIERIYFYWDLDILNLDIRELFKEILFVEPDGFAELISSVFFMDTRDYIIFNFYDSQKLEIVSSSSENLYKYYKE